MHKLIRAPNVRSVKGDADRTKQQIRKFMIHAANLVPLVVIDARNFGVLRHCMSKSSPHIFAVSRGKRNKSFTQNLHVQTLNKPWPPRSKTYCGRLPPSRPPFFLVTNYLWTYFHPIYLQTLEEEKGEELQLQLKVFFEHKEEDFDEFAQRYVSNLNK
jgi:hypothetical protein